MPKITSQAIAVAPLQFSPVNLKALGATEYTMAGLAMDDSTSVQPAIDLVRKCIENVVLACAKNPRANNTLLRTITFGSGLQEVHGFKELKDINPADYATLGGRGGNTALNDAALNLINSVKQQGIDLGRKDYAANGIIVVITDGEENCSTFGEGDVKAALEDCYKTEALESIVTILVGVTANKTLDGYLKDWKEATGFMKYENVADTTPDSLAKLADFISKSISAQSQALGSGGPSKALPSLSI